MSSERPSRLPEFGRPAAREYTLGKTTHPVATVQPFDVNGVRTMFVGTAMWGIAIIAMLPFWSTLRDNGQSWWLWTAMAGFGLGLLGIEYCRTRATRSEATPQPRETPTPKSKKPRLGSKKNTATDRLMQAAEPNASHSESFTPGKESLGRKHHLLEQDATISEPDLSDPKTPTAPAYQPPSTAGRPVGRRRKPE